jgi:hypothetical protein
MERFFDGMNQEISEIQGGKGQIRKIQKKTRRKEWRRERDEIFNLKIYICGGSRTRVFSIGWEHPWATALMQPSLMRTHLSGNLPYNITSC